MEPPSFITLPIAAFPKFLITETNLATPDASLSALTKFDLFGPAEHFFFDQAIGLQSRLHTTWNQNTGKVSRNKNCSSRGLVRRTSMRVALFIQRFVAVIRPLEIKLMSLVIDFKFASSSRHRLEFNFFLFADEFFFASTRSSC